jgi:hypothetical protein
MDQVNALILNLNIDFVSNLTMFQGIESIDLESFLQEELPRIVSIAQIFVFFHIVIKYRELIGIKFIIMSKKSRL